MIEYRVSSIKNCGQLVHVDKAVLGVRGAALKMEVAFPLIKNKLNQTANRVKHHIKHPKLWPNDL